MNYFVTLWLIWRHRRLSERLRLQFSWYRICVALKMSLFQKVSDIFDWIIKNKLRFILYIQSKISDTFGNRLVFSATHMRGHHDNCNCVIKSHGDRNEQKISSKYNIGLNIHKNKKYSRYFGIIFHSTIMAIYLWKQYREKCW